MLALVLADGDVPTRAALDAAWPGWSDGIELVVAADGGARHAATLGFDIDAWVGDGDSVAPELLAVLEARGVKVRRADPDKDESDTELAVLWAAGHGARRIVLIGATGGPRIDHELANLSLLAAPTLFAAGIGVVVLTPRSRIRLVHRGAPGIRVGDRIGDIVTLLPFAGPVDGIVTAGLRYPLRGEGLPFGTPRGLSNVVVERGASVSVRDGMLLVIETPAEPVGTDDQTASTIGP